MGIINSHRKLQLLQDELYAIVKVINISSEYVDVDALLNRKEQIELSIEKLENELYR